MKNVIQSKIFRIILILTLILTVIVFIRIKCVFIDGAIHNNNTERISGSINEIKISELNRCKNLKELYLKNINNNYFNEMKAFNSLETLIIMNSECEISDNSIQKINQMKCLKFLGVDLSDIELKGLQNDSLEILTLTRSNIFTLRDVSNCQNLIELRLSSVNIQDVSDFAILDNIKALKIYDTEIKDISSILNMEALEELTISNGLISEYNLRMLEENGINVIEMSNDEEQ